MIYQRQVIGYHGCLRPRFEDALLRGLHPPFSEENYDWLGRGVYFWEHGPERALEWARSKASRAGEDPAEACVLGAVIQLGQCFDLLDAQATDLLEPAYQRLRKFHKDTEVPLPKNIGRNPQGDVLLRYLDRAVIEIAIYGLNEEPGAKEIQTVRGAFWEGGQAFDGSEVQKRSHIQIAVRDTSCIVGYFRPEISFSSSEAP